MNYFIVLIVVVLPSLFFIILHFKQSSKKTMQTFYPQQVDIIEKSINLTPKEFVENYNNQQIRVKGGSLCFWGHWFGRPYDNYHGIASVNLDTVTNILTIQFNEGEILTVTNPAEIEVYNRKILINGADKVFWQWYKYGEEKEPENLFYFEFFSRDSLITGSTNVNWYKGDWNELHITKPAVLLT